MHTFKCIHIFNYFSCTTQFYLHNIINNNQYLPLSIENYDHLDKDIAILFLSRLL